MNAAESVVRPDKRRIDLEACDENAFDKYERGLVEPSGPTVQLIRVLDRHPELAEEIR